MAKAKKKEPERKAVVQKPAAKPPSKAKEKVVGPKAKVKKKGNKRIITRPGTPGSPGVRENQRDPFLGADDIWDMGEEQAGWDAESSDAEEERDQRLAELPQTLDDIKQNGQRLRERQSENAIERGIFRSSINEIALTDINVAETVSTEAAKSLVANAQIELDRIKNDIETVRKPRLFVKAFGRSRENAEQWNADQEWQTEPTAATPSTTVTDYDARTPGIQNKQQANRNAAKRAQQQPSKPGAGRGTQKPQPNRPGGPRNATIIKRPATPKPKKPERILSVNGRRR